jgi:hypothetical protein
MYSSTCAITGFPCFLNGTNFHACTSVCNCGQNFRYFRTTASFSVDYLTFR